MKVWYRGVMGEGGVCRGGLGGRGCRVVVGREGGRGV